MSLIDDREIEEALGSMPEAKSSVSYTLFSKLGYSLIFTVRSNNEAELIDELADLEAGFNKRGYQPDRKYVKTETNATQGIVEAPRPSSDGATEKQVTLLKAKNLWVEGMSKSEASAKISSVLGKK
jgi:hypothetical protein